MTTKVTITAAPHDDCIVGVYRTPVPVAGVASPEFEHIADLQSGTSLDVDVWHGMQLLIYEIPQVASAQTA